MQTERVKKALEHLEQLDLMRQTWRDHWEDISDYVLPAYGQYLETIPNDGEKRNSKIFDHTPTFAVRVCAAGMMGGMSSPSRPWYRLTLGDKDAAKQPVIKDWLNQVEHILALALAQSGFYQSAHQTYTELVGFGSGLTYIMPGDRHPFRFINSTIGEFYWAEGRDGIVDTVYRDLKFTAKRVVETFGESKVSPEIKEMYKLTPFEYVDVVHKIGPRKGRDVSKLDAFNKPYESLWFEKGAENSELLRSGFDRKPFVAPRWTVTGADSYGRSPTMDILPSIKTLHDKAKTSISNEHLSARPPLNVPEEMRGTVNLLPGGINYTSNPQHVVTPVMQVQWDAQKSMMAINDLRAQVSRGLFNDLFMMISEGNDNMTATEVMERREEKMTMLGPVTERLQTEYFDPLITSCIDILAKRGDLPTLPPEYAELVANYEVEYVSIIAQAQKMAGTRGILQFSQYVGQLAAVKPDALDKFDADQAIDEYGDMLGVPTSIIVPDEEVQGIRDKRQAEMEKQKQIEMQMAQGQIRESQAKQMQGAAGAVKQITEATGNAGDEARAMEGLQ